MNKGHSIIKIMLFISLLNLVLSGCKSNNNQSNVIYNLTQNQQAPKNSEIIRQNEIIRLVAFGASDMNYYIVLKDDHSLEISYLSGYPAMLSSNVFITDAENYEQMQYVKILSDGEFEIIMKALKEIENQEPILTNNFPTDSWAIGLKTQTNIYISTYDHREDDENLTALLNKIIEIVPTEITLKGFA